MSEQEWADRFVQDLDDLLRGVDLPEQDTAPVDYRQSLDVARILATTDRSDESRRRYATRQRLLTLASDSWEGQARSGRDGFWDHPLVMFPLALVTLALICAIMLPSSAGWAQIGQPDLALPAIETPVAAAQTAYAEWRGAGAQFPKLPPTANAAPTPTQAAMLQPVPMHMFVATGTPGPQITSTGAGLFGR